MVKLTIVKLKPSSGAFCLIGQKRIGSTVDFVAHITCTVLAETLNHAQSIKSLL